MEHCIIQTTNGRIISGAYDQRQNERTVFVTVSFSDGKGVTQFAPKSHGGQTEAHKLILRKLIPCQDFMPDVIATFNPSDFLRFLMEERFPACRVLQEA